jgi:hypothetical protein
MNEGIPVNILEKRAADQRLHLHDTVREIRLTAQEKLNIKRNVRNNLALVSGVLTVVGLAVGYAVTGVFTRD